ncbi:tetratricopeptide repeat protein [Risungbinella massiliensis]|uniref:tetratricopeptide repeat protein n=1 Tax=Risungbinella massiliensis TaxID=1329796 RepID=UPI0005CC3873|nr:tetratricopeptide repeat protein [Risungbinella massiliensis]
MDEEHSMKEIGDDIIQLLKKADYASEVGRPDLVLDCGFQILKLVPEHFLGYMTLAIGYFSSGDIVASQEAIDKSIASNAEFADTWDLKGLITHYGTQKIDEAILYFQKALDLDPECVAAIVHYAGAELDLGHLDRAEELVMQATKLDPERKECPLLLGMIYTKRGQLEEAETFYREALRINPESLLVHLNYGHYLMVNRNDPKKAYPILKEAIRLNPDDKKAQDYYRQVVKEKSRDFGWDYKLWMGLLLVGLLLSFVFKFGMD